MKSIKIYLPILIFFLSVFSVFGQTRKQLELQRKKLNKEIKQVFDAMTYQSEVIFTGHIQAEDLKNVYGAGLALTYVSYFEGFGIPLVEAMKCELPIISSDKTSLVEDTTSGIFSKVLKIFSLPMPNSSASSTMGW